MYRDDHQTCQSRYRLKGAPQRTFLWRRDPPAARKRRGEANTVTFSPGSIGDVFAVRSPRMSRLEKIDTQPGVPPDSRLIASGAVVLIMPVAADRRLTLATQLVLRCEPDGRIFAALGRGPVNSAGS